MMRAAPETRGRGPAPRLNVGPQDLTEAPDFLDDSPDSQLGEFLRSLTWRGYVRVALEQHLAQSTERLRMTEFGSGDEAIKLLAYERAVQRVLTEILEHPKEFFTPQGVRL